jgi:elongation factor Ts
MFHPFRLIRSYVHQGRIGVLVEFGLETDFAARTELFDRFGNDVLLHIAASAPRDIEGLLAQPFVKRPETSVSDLVSQVAAQLRERVGIVRFMRWDVDEPIERAPNPSPDPPRAPAVALRIVG